jgi:hypothetical protein
MAAVEQGEAEKDMRFSMVEVAQRIEITFDMEPLITNRGIAQLIGGALLVAPTMPAGVLGKTGVTSVLQCLSSRCLSHLQHSKRLLGS